MPNGTSGGMPQGGAAGGGGMPTGGSSLRDAALQQGQQQQGQSNQGQQGQEGLQQGQEQGQQQPTFEGWLAGQDGTVKGLIESHVKGLKTALETERTERGNLSKQLKDLAGKADKDSDLQKALTGAQQQLEAAERRAVFAEEASRPEIGCSNPKLAFVLATQENLFDRRGNPDWTAIKAAAPELFRRGTGSADGGAGAGNGPQKFDMNMIIRRAAGRG